MTDYWDYTEMHGQQNIKKNKLKQLHALFYIMLHSDNKVRPSRRPKVLCWIFSKTVHMVAVDLSNAMCSSIILLRLPLLSPFISYEVEERIQYIAYIKVKQSVPLQAWSGPEGSRKLRLPDFVTTAQDGGMVVSLTHRPPLPPGNAPGTHFWCRPQGHSAIERILWQWKIQWHQLGSNQWPSDL